MSGWFDFLKYLLPDRVAPKVKGSSQLDLMFQNLVEEARIPGMSICIVKDDKTILEKGYGFESLETRNQVNSRSTVFRIASISKCITGLALGKMVEEGLMDWDASFYDFVPYYPKKKFDFTIRQLASHTAGIRGYRGKEFALNQPYAIKESIEVFKNDPLVFEPGKGYLYNSFDSVLLSLAIQEASSMAFEEYVKEKVLIPLQMANTYTPKEVENSSFMDDDISVADFYTLKGKTPKKAITVNNQYKLGGGGYLSTCSDIIKMGQSILNGNLLKEETYKQLFAAQNVNGQSVYYGLGFQVSQDIEGRHYVGHVGNSVGAYTNFFVYPDEKVVISILINCTDPKAQGGLDEAIKQIFNKNL
ncbi:serine hydrolase domain-containing protein [Flagellimonas meridianipacifica]|uniref:CubicO group peptidase (Beta-lactamase class C family) n=1 Tax=Flagellimonas meridianipacifica TaxID=1080225 RepID=A0A2T0MJW2_9FLAO|nr:serine hydrolase domain-containing protein [Allomuricauda pacifica]PRX57839.1 CubicO group peptidase (beta-lactamase class C family) [Allomuricauda pacifica]